MRSLAGAVREMEAGLGAGQAPPRAPGEQVAETTTQASNDVVSDVESGTCTPAIERRPDASTQGATADAEPTASAPPAELRYKVQFTADQAYVDLLEEARNLLQHQLPTRDLVEVQRRRSSYWCASSARESMRPPSVRDRKLGSLPTGLQQ